MSPGELKPRQNNFFDTCSRCRTEWSCCHETTPPITEGRRHTIEAYLRNHNIPIVNPFATTDYVFPRMQEDGYCIFHDKKTRKCLIHSVKPETCIAGPITFDINKRTGNIEWFIKTQEICDLAGEIYQDRRLLRKHVACAKKELMCLIKDLDSKALKAILRKDEPSTFKIGETS